jgi:hypothetical protein
MCNTNRTSMESNPNKASHLFKYWTLKLKEVRNNIYLYKLQKIRDQVSEEEQQQGLSTTNIITHLQYARKSLINARKQSDQLQIKHLDSKQAQLLEDGKVTKAELLYSTMQKEQQQHCWKFFKLLRHGNKSNGGISHVFLPDQHDKTHIHKSK